MKKRKKLKTGTSLLTSSIQGNSPLHDGEKECTVKINKKVPAPRDGHIAVLFNEKMLIFGGDRHHMPFNDLFMIDINDFFFKNSK